LFGVLSAVGIEITATPEFRGTAIIVRVEQVRLGPVAVPLPLALGYVRKSLADRPGITVDAAAGTILLDLGRMALFGPALTVRALRLDGRRITVRLGSPRQS